MLISSGKEIKIWNWASELVDEYQIANKSGSPGSLKSFSVKSDCSEISCVVDNNQINLVNFQSGQKHELKDTVDAKCCSYDSEGRRLAVGNGAGLIELYDFKSQSARKRSWKVNQLDGYVNCICWSNNDRHVATGNSNGSIVLFNTLMNQFSKPYVFKPKASDNMNGFVNNSVTDLQYSTCNLASSYENGSVLVWDVNKESPICEFRAHDLPCTSMTLSPVSPMLMLSGGLDSNLVLYDINTKKVINRIKSNCGITSIDMHKDGSNICVAGVNGYISLYDLRSKLEEPMSMYKAHNGIVYRVEYLKNSSLKWNTSAKNSVSHSEIPFVTSSNQSLSGPIDLIKKSTSLNFDIHNKNLTSNFHISSRNELINANNIIEPISLYSPENQRTNVRFGQKFNEFESSQPSESTSSSESFILHKKVQQANQAANNKSLNGNQSTSNLAYDNNKSNSNSSTLVLENLTNNYQSQNDKLNGSKMSTLDRVSTNRGGNMYSPIQSSTVNSSKIRDELLPSDVIPFEKSSPNANANASKNTSQNVKKPKTPYYSESGNNSPINSNAFNMNAENSPSNLASESKKKTSPIKNASNDRSKVDVESYVNKNSDLNLNLNAESMDAFKSVLKDVIDDLREEMMSESFKFKAEMLREILTLKQELKREIEKNSINTNLIDELQKLREENKRLKKLF